MKQVTQSCFNCLFRVLCISIIYIGIAGILIISFTSIFHAQITSIRLPTADSSSGFRVINNLNANLFRLNGDAGFYLGGTYGAGNIPKTGAGTRLMWHPRRSAFRAGFVDGIQWDDQNIGSMSSAFGYNTTANGSYSIASGYYSTSSGNYSTAFGQFTTASGMNAVALGAITLATSNYSTAMGYRTIAVGEYSTAAGAWTTASGKYSQSSGFYTTASGNTSTALGDSTVAIGFGSFAIGFRDTAVGPFSTAMGYETSASGKNAVTMGYQTAARGDNSVAIGSNTIASGNISHATGFLTTASGNLATSMGYATVASGDYSTAMGMSASASGYASTAMGYQTTASGYIATAMGDHAIANGTNSIAIGSFVSTNHYGSFVFGDNSTAVVTSSSTYREMTMRFSGGYRLFSSSDLSAGVTLAPGGGSWSSVSDARKKENFIKAKGEYFLNSLAQLRLGSWNYISQDSKTFRHYGPMAQEIYRYFGKDGIGTIGNDTTLASADMDGIMMICLQALEKRTIDLNKTQKQLSEAVYQLQQKDKKITEHEAKINSLGEKIEKLTQLLSTSKTTNPSKLTTQLSKE